MLAVNTNVLLRFLTQDDAEQGRLARSLMLETLTEKRPGFVSAVVICETAWVLARFYGLSQPETRDALRPLLGAPQLVFGDEPALRIAFDQDADLADAIIHEIGRGAGCSETVTFNRRFARLPGVRLLES